MDDQSAEAKRQIEIVSQQIVRAKINYDIWWLYVGKDTRLKIIDALENYSEFLKFDEHAHFIAMIVHLGNVWDKTKGAANLPSIWRNFCATSIQETPKTEFDACQKLADKVTKIRHNAIAHRSKKTDYQSAFKLASISPDEILNLIVSSLDQVNLIRANNGMDEQDFNPMPVEDFLGIANALGAGFLKPQADLDKILGEG